MAISCVGTEALHAAAQVERLRLKVLLEHSQETCRRLGSAHQQLMEIVCRTRELVAVSREARRVRQDTGGRTANRPRDFLQLLQSAGFTEADLPAITDELIEVYQTATACGDDQAVALIGRALKQIGCHIARELGPRQAGVLLN